MPRVCANVDFEPLGVALTGHHLELAALHRLAKRAEALGYSVLIVDGDSGFLRQRRSAPIHASSVLSASVLAATRRIQAGGIRLPSYWNAALLARELATLQELSRGRAFGLLGVGAGRDESHFGRRVRSPGDRVRHLEELLDSVRALLDGQTVTRRGRFVHLEDAFIRPPSARVPLVV
ncbi:MAG: LLM class flavin-dependent oxidoreductase, partial [Myxococcota bacterium]